MLLIGLISIAGCIKQGINLPKETGKTWVEIDPIQCLGNPWEVDWLKAHEEEFKDKPYGAYGEYPRDFNTLELESEEIRIIKDYYQKQGITIFDVKSEWTHEGVCDACDCPEGYTLYLLISDSDVDKMLELGYKISSE